MNPKYWQQGTAPKKQGIGEKNERVELAAIAKSAKEQMTTHIKEYTHIYMCVLDLN